MIDYAVGPADLAYSDALTLVACGEEFDIARSYLIDNYPALTVDQVNDTAYDAYRDALKQGVDREDIDPSWHSL